MLLLLACADDPEPIVIEGSVAHVTLTLLNPTTCSACDPFAGIDALQLDVISGASVVASERFDYPGETPTLPDLDGFGVVRIVLYGLVGDDVFSVGRTPELTLGPGVDRTVPMTFLPANQALPLTSGMTVNRSRHVAWRRRDGKVLLMGGVDPARGHPFDTTETWDPDEGRFSAGLAVLPVAVAAPTVDPQEDGTLFLTGGETWSSSGAPSVATTAVYDDTADSITRAGDMAWPRAGHCISRYLDRQGMIFGGSAETTQGDYFKVDSGTQTWAFQGVPMLDFDPTSVSGCITLDDGRTFVQGRTAESTGLWEFTEETLSTGTAGDAFRKLPGGAGDDGAALARLEDGRVWIVGGQAPDERDPTDQTRFFTPDGEHFDAGPTLARARFAPQVDDWIAAGWRVVGCGWSDADETEPTSSLEFIDPETGEGTGDVPFDRARDGCALTTLRDGAVLVTGGFGARDEDEIDAAIVVPWFGVEGDATAP